jgi:tRNA-splicing endonuclease subunit Sen54
MGNPVSGEDEEGEDDERLDLAALQGFAEYDQSRDARTEPTWLTCSKIQRRPLEDDVDGEESRVKIVIPKRGEKDFEPLAETVNLQEMMLQRSREALFGALAGVRGGNRFADSWARLIRGSLQQSGITCHLDT